MRLEWDEHGRFVLVASRTNLLSLLAKLDGHPPGSACILEGGSEAAGIRLKAEEDDVHYAHRDRGLMHEKTEKEVLRRRNLGITPDPPEHLADAWRRYQAGGDVTPNELRQLDEWRIDLVVDF